VKNKRNVLIPHGYLNLRRYHKMGYPEGLSNVSKKMRGYHSIYYSLCLSSSI
jgi:hypothetical protein